MQSTITYKISDIILVVEHEIEEFKLTLSSAAVECPNLELIDSIHNQLHQHCTGISYVLINQCSKRLRVCCDHMFAKHSVTYSTWLNLHQRPTHGRLNCAPVMQEKIEHVAHILATTNWLVKLSKKTLFELPREIVASIIIKFATDELNLAHIEHIGLYALNYLQWDNCRQTIQPTFAKLSAPHDPHATMHFTRFDTAQLVKLVRCEMKQGL